MIISKKPASALLLSFFLMSLLIVLGLSVSLLVIKDVQAVRTVMGGTQARYAAEGMTELGLKILKDKLPGYEVESGTLEHEFSGGAKASLEINARENTVPCSVRNNENGESVWRRLAYNESVELPLFASGQKNSYNIENFYVEFYVGSEDGTEIDSRDIDVLRWKILGIKKNGISEAISEYIPLDGVKFTPENPTYFGSHAPVAAREGYSNAKYTELGPVGGRVFFIPNFPIKTFLERHEYSYLIMTNVVQAKNPENYFIFFKLHSTVPSKEAICEFVTLKSVADNEFGSVRQSIYTVVKEGENLPVFDFALYHTSGEIKDESVEIHKIDFLLGDLLKH